MAPIAKPQKRARQPDFPHDHLLHVTAAAEQGIDHAHGRQTAPVPIPSEKQRQQHDKDNEPGHHARNAGAPAMFSRRHGRF